MVIIKAKRIPQKEISGDEILARFCYLFPQYTFLAARKLPFKRIIQMIKVARKEQAKEWYNLTRAIASPHMKSKNAVSNLLSEFKKIIDE